MRIALTLALAASLISTSTSAQSVLGEDVYVVPSDAAPVTVMASWDDRGMVKSASGTGVFDAPDGATQYSATEANWPTARVRVLRFEKARGGVLHPITDETLLYVLEGAAQVGVGSGTVTLAAGDVVSFPSGALRNAGMASDATIVTWTAPSLTGENAPTHVKGVDVEEGGFGAIKLKRYQFPGNSVRAVQLAADGSTGANSAKTDSLIYVTAGPMTFHQEGRYFVVNEGDFIREVAGAQHFWTVQEDSGFVTTSGLPLDMQGIDPDKATDVPPQR